MQVDAHITMAMYDVSLTSPMGYRGRRLRTGSVFRTNPKRVAERQNNSLSLLEIDMSGTCRTERRM